MLLFRFFRVESHIKVLKVRPSVDSFCVIITVVSNKICPSPRFDFNNAHARWLRGLALQHHYSKATEAEQECRRAVECARLQGTLDFSPALGSRKCRMPPLFERWRTTFWSSDWKSLDDVVVVVESLDNLGLFFVFVFDTCFIEWNSHDKLP